VKDAARLTLDLLDLLDGELDGERLDVVVEVLDLASAAKGDIISHILSKTSEEKDSPDNREDVGGFRHHVCRKIEDQRLLLASSSGVVDWTHKQEQ
jgi:hypothetical protein